MQVKILDHRLEVTFIDPELWGNENYGDFDGAKMKIRIVKGLQRDAFMTTLLHELTHLKQHIFGLEMDEDEANRDGLFWFSFIRSSDLAKRLWKAYNE
jgi:hypothetical protein